MMKGSGLGPPPAIERPTGNLRSPLTKPESTAPAPFESRLSLSEWPPPEKPPAGVRDAGVGPDNGTTRGQPGAGPGRS
jgi:hypothetical protein